MALDSQILARRDYCHNDTLGRRDFYRQLCVALGLTPSATAEGVFYAVASHIEELAIERAHPVFLLDEAHLLRQDTLEHLHILMNYEWDSRALLSLVLVGLPELEPDTPLRVLRENPATERIDVAVDDPGILIDLNTHDDLIRGEAHARDQRS